MPCSRKVASAVLSPRITPDRGALLKRGNDGLPLITNQNGQLLQEQFMVACRYFSSLLYIGNLLLDFGISVLVSIVYRFG
jgi:hypothetical protein